MHDHQKEIEIFLREEKDFFSFVQDCANIFHIGDIVGLKGDVGAGKTTFARTLLRTMLDDPSLEVPSPTFTLLQEYERLNPNIKIYHLDLYRLQDSEEVDHLGLEDLLKDGFALIEWPEKATGKIIETFTIEFFHEEKKRRRILFMGDESRLNKYYFLKRS